MSKEPKVNTWIGNLVATASAAVLLFVGNPEVAKAQENTVAITAWGEYVPKDVITGFEEKTGIKVVYDYFDSLETLEAKLLTGNSGYDVVFPSALVANRLMQAELLAELDKSKLPNSSNLDPKIMEFLALHDEGNRHGVPYLWGTTGVIYNPALVFERMENAPIDSLDMFFDPDVVSKFADCGVAMINSPEEVVAIAFNYLGLDPFTEDKEDFKKVDGLLAPIRPYIRHFNTGSIISEMATGDLCLALGWSGDAGLAYARALEVNNGIEVFYSMPKEGTEVFFDFMSIPADAPNPDNAHAFINYLMEPEVIAGVTNLYYYPNGNSASLEYVIPEVKDDPNVYPPEEMMAKLFPNLPRGLKALRYLKRSWSDFTNVQ